MAGKSQSKKSLTSNVIPKLFAALDLGNGECVGVSNEVTQPVSFEPVVAPMTEGRAYADNELARFTLRIEDGRKLVFGIDDVYAHGQRDLMRRQSGMDRYLGDDFLNFFDVLMLHLFPSYRGHDQRISPIIALNLPVSQYNKPEVSQALIDNLSGIRNMVDQEGCILQMSIDPRNIIILPESTGALMHYAFRAGERRGDTDGQTLVIDIGYETTDTSLYLGMKYQRDRARTIQRAGMGNIARVVAAEAAKSIRDVDVSMVDRELRKLVGRTPDNMIIQLNGKPFDAGRIYPFAVRTEAQKIADGTLTHYQTDVSRAVLGGGGTYHLQDELRTLLPWKIKAVTTPELANVLGAYETLMERERRLGMKG